MIGTLDGKRKRRFTRFSLRTFLLVMVAVCIVLGWKVERVRRQREAVNLVLQMGGIVGYEYEGPFIDEPHGIAGPRLPKPAPEWLIKRLGIDFFDEVVSVDLTVKPVDLTHIKGLAALRRLDLNSAMGVSDVSPMNGLTKLEWLVLSGTNVSDLSPLQDMTQLKVLYLGQTQVVDLAPLQMLTQLRSLDLSGTRVADISILESMTELQVLSLAGTQVSDIAALKGLKELTWLDLRGTKVSDLAPLREATGVKIILDSNQDLRIPGELEGRVRRY